MNKIGLFLFRKDLRLHDNLGLINLSKLCTKIIPIFILDNYQIDITEQNKYYRSNNAIQFMCESLLDLNKQLDNKLIQKIIHAPSLWDKDYPKYEGIFNIPSGMINKQKFDEEIGNIAHSKSLHNKYKKELYDGDSVIIPQIGSEEFEVIVDKDLNLEYNPLIF